MKIAMGWKGRRWFHKLSGIYRRSFRFLKKWMLCGNGENKTWQTGQTEHIKSKKSWSKCWRDGAWRFLNLPSPFLRFIYNSLVWQLLTIKGLNFAVLSTFYLSSKYASILKIRHCCDVYNPWEHHRCLSCPFRIKLTWQLPKEFFLVN